MAGGETRIESDVLHPTKISSDMKAFVSDKLKTPLFNMLSAYFEELESDQARLDNVLDDDNTVTECNKEFLCSSTGYGL
jgi:hypothetical protein